MPVANIRNREKRTQLPSRQKPYWKKIRRGMALGYRRNKRGGVWIVRCYENGRYHEKRLAIADDLGDGTGLSHRQALEAAVRGEVPDEDACTVEDALEAYLANYQARSGRDRSIGQRIRRIRDKLGDIEVDKLTKKDIEKWRNSLVRTDTKDKELLRKSRYSTNRNLTILKAALNEALTNGHATSDLAWRTCKSFKNVNAPKIRYLSSKETKRLVNACEPDFRLLVQCALLTGCRLGEILSMRVQDVDLEARTVHLPHTKSGIPRHVVLTDEGRTFFQQQVIGKKPNNLLLTKNDGELWGSNSQIRRMKDACAAARIDPPISFHILRHCYGASLAAKGVPLQIIAAALGHADTRMTERHYAHIAPSHVRDQIQKHLPKIGIKPGMVAAL